MLCQKENHRSHDVVHDSGMPRQLTTGLAIHLTFPHERVMERVTARWAEYRTFQVKCCLRVGVKVNVARRAFRRGQEACGGNNLPMHSSATLFRH
jgi:hypothetical protein